MKKYLVRLEEINDHYYEIEADSEEEAGEIAEFEWGDGILPDKSNFVHCEAVGCEEIAK